MKKILLFIMVLFLFTGCKAEYNLLIDDDLKVMENVNMTCTEETFDIYYKSSKLNVINMLLDEEAKTLLDDNNYRYQIIEETTPYVNVTKEYQDMTSFANQTIFSKQYFESLNVKEEKGVITLTTTGFKPIDFEDPGRYGIYSLTIAITSRYKVLDHNAYKVNTKTNTYYWEITGDTLEFDLKLSIDSKVKFNPKLNTYLLIFITILIVILTWIIIYRDYKKHIVIKDES